MRKEIVPQSDRVSNTSKARKAARGAVREHPRVVVKNADPGQVRAVVKLMSTKNLPFGQACSRVGVSQSAFWRRALNDAELKRELACLCISKPWDRADQMSVGNASALSVFAKIGEKMAASLSPNDWGEKVQVESRSLVITTNLDFRVCSDLAGITVIGEDVSAGLEEARQAICGAVIQAEVEKKPVEVEAVEATELDIEAVFRAQGGRPIVRPRSE